MHMYIGVGQVVSPRLRLRMIGIIIIIIIMMIINVSGGRRCGWASGRVSRVCCRESCVGSERVQAR
jgi:hypothetical protein